MLPGNMEKRKDDASVFDVTNRFERIRYLRNVYWKLISKGLYKIGVVEMVRTQFPYYLKDAAVPPSLNVEFTNYCQLQCTYCTSPLKLRPRGFMSDDTFKNLNKQIKLHKIKRVRVVGNGEPTLHPEFPSMIRELSKSTRYIELKTNWQYVNDKSMKAILKSNIDVIRISVDSNKKELYESLRVGGNFEKLLSNLESLMEERDRLNSQTMVLITVMLRPSEQRDVHEILRFWQPYCDIVSRQYILNVSAPEKDVYHAQSALYNEFPRCSFPFKELKIFWNGNIPLCKYSHLQTGDSTGIILGNININSLAEVWNHKVMKEYRVGHRKRQEELMPICRGCIGT